MEIRYSQTQEERKKTGIIAEYLDSLKIDKQFYLKFVPAVTKLYARNYFMAFFLLIIMHAQEIAILLSYRQQIGQSSDDYTSYFIQYINYTLLINLANQAVSKGSAEKGIFYFTFIINCFILFIFFGLFMVFAYTRYDIKRIRALNTFISFLLQVYIYILFLPSLKSSFIMISLYTQLYAIIGYINIIFSWIIGFFIVFHDYDYSFLERDKLSKRFSYFDVWLFIQQGMLPFFLQYSNEKVLTAFSCIYSIQKIIIYFLDQTYFNERMCCFYSMIITYYCSTSLMFLLFLISPNSLNFTLLMLLSIPLSFHLGRVIYNFLQKNTFKNCMGRQDLTDLAPYQLDIYIRLLNKNLNFFYEDYIRDGQGFIFENLYVNHQINCQTDDYRCFCHDFQRQDNKLEFEEYIGQDFRKKYVMFYIVNLYEQYLRANQKSSYVNSVTFGYISFLFEIMKIPTKSFNVIYISQQKLISENANLRDLFVQQILMYRIKKEFQQFFSNPTYQNQRIFVMAPILFDENMQYMKQLLKEQLVNTGVFYDYLCSNFIDLSIVNQYARILYQNLNDLKLQLEYLYDLNPDNLELQQYSMHYSNLLEFENSKVSQYIKKSKNLTKKMLLTQDRNIQVFSKNACIVYASLIKKDGLIKKVSNSFQKIYGIENKLIIGKTLNSLIPRGLYNTHDDIISNFKNKGHMNIINKEQRMVFGLNGEGFIIPLMIRLKLENINDDFGVCSLLTSVNQDKEYLFISDEGQIMDITKKLYNLIFKDLSSINDLRRFDIKHLIPLIWGIQEVSEYDKVFYSILVVSKKLMFMKENKVQDLKSHHKMQEVVDQICLDDIIYSISFKVCIITTSIGLNFKFVEIDSFKREDNLAKRKAHISHLKMCLNEILNNNVNALFKELTDANTTKQGSNENQQINLNNIYDIANMDQSQVLNSEIDSSFYRHMKNSIPNKIQSSSNIKDFGEDSSRISQQHKPKNQTKYNKNFVYFSNASPNVFSPHPNNEYDRDNRIMEESNTNIHDSKIASGALSPRSFLYQAAGLDQMSLPPTTDRQRLENNPLLGEFGAPPPNRVQNGNHNPSLLSLQSPMSQAGLLSKKNENNHKQIEQMFFPSSPHYNFHNQFHSENYQINIQKTKSNSSTPRANNNNNNNNNININNQMLSFKQPDLVTNSSDNSEPKNVEPGQIVVKRSQSRSKSEKFVQNPKALKKVEVIKIEHNINQEQHELIKEIEQDDLESRYLRIGSNDNDFKMVKIENHFKIQQVPSNSNIQIQSDFERDPINQNEMITSYKQILKMNQNQQQIKAKQINAVISKQNTSRSLLTYNQEMKLSLDKEVFKKEQQNLQLQDIQKVNQLDEIILDTHENNLSIDEDGNNSDKDNIESEGKKRNIHHSITQNVENNNDQSSVHSSNKTSEQTRRKIIIRKIKSNHISSGLKAMVYMGITAFFIFVAVSVMLYVQNNKSYSLYIQNFNKVTQASFLFLDVISVVKVFSYLGITASQPYFQEDRAYSTQRLQYYINQFKDIFYSFVNDKNTDQPYYDYLLNQPFKIELFHVEGTREYPVVKKNETQITAISQFMYIIQQFKEIDFDSSNMLFLWQNMHEFKINMQNMQNLIQQQAQDQFDNISLMQIMMLIIILIITCTLIFTVLPLSVYNIMRCEEILKLFGCFHPEKLQKLIDVIEETVNKLDLISYYTKLQSQKYYQKNLEISRKDQTIANHPNSTFTRDKNRSKTQKNRDIQSQVQSPSFQSPSQNPRNNTNMQVKQQIKPTKYQQQAQKENAKQQINGSPPAQVDPSKNPSKISSGGIQQKNQHLPTNETQQQSSHGQINNNLKQTKAQSQFTKKTVVQGNNAEMPIATKTHIKRQAQKRTRQIASFNSLPRFDLKLVTIALIIIVIMMIPPVLNILFSNKYMDEGKVTLKERITVLNTIVQIVQNEAAHFNIWLDSLIYDLSQSDPNTLLSYQSLSNVTLTNDQVISNLQSLLQTNQPRRDQSNYNNIYLGILKDNICSTLKDYPSSFNTNFTVSQCESLYQGVMQRGYIIASKQIIGDFDNQFKLYQQNLQNVQTVLQSEYANQNIRDLYRSIVFMLDSFTALDTYSSNSQQSYNDYINLISLYLFIFYIIVVIMIFFSGWTHVFFRFYNQFDSTKKLLCLFNMNLILENAFLMQFLKNNTFGVK
ncbi:transmembrane protein, putative (macronuclear) [Tetrahymena thermophila SB210]|uniref:Transmembrane protein, putative n=1 Tax=Tetrahymena thermophila (strain SB210) TaxID=312017 RepID=Q23RX3_TETTS|nr:transmembrane protein, putative [Tetrahymena thermophila SB210]EAR99266.2 transmembrane protein, putative [Tetrahymena thermophila SB210]|eukprot:XP_001019511.2 transmembrane protein, putative [Tetrahymena thermophila SB210]